jgi:hypothetical protein
MNFSPSPGATSRRGRTPHITQRHLILGHWVSIGLLEFDNRKGGVKAAHESAAWEQGRRNPTIVTLYELATALGVNHVELVVPSNEDGDRS